MQRGWWRWLLYVFVAWQVATTTFWAFRVPWSWTPNQCLFVFFALCAVIVAGLWGYVWFHDGTAAVKERWAFVKQQRNSTPTKSIFLWGLVFWVLVALALVFAFNMMQR
jgi:hypothetical protein